MTLRIAILAVAFIPVLGCGGGVFVGSDTSESTRGAGSDQVIIEVVPDESSPNGLEEINTDGLGAPEQVTAWVGVRQLRLETAAEDCAGSDAEVILAGPFRISALDGTVEPPFPALEVEQSHMPCRLLIDWSGGDTRDLNDLASAYLFGPATTTASLLATSPHSGRLVVTAATQRSFEERQGRMQLGITWRSWLDGIDPETLKLNSAGDILIAPTSNVTAYTRFVGNVESSISIP